MISIKRLVSKWGVSKAKIKLPLYLWIRAKETNENNLKNGGEEKQREKQLIYS